MKLYLNLILFYNLLLLNLFTKMGIILIITCQLDLAATT